MIIGYAASTLAKMKVELFIGSQQTKGKYQLLKNNLKIRSKNKKLNY